MAKNWNKLLRPMTWADLAGQSQLVGTFNTMIMADNFPSFSIFAGPTGVGKSCTAELVAKTILCTGDGVQPCNHCPNCDKFNSGISTNIIKYDMPNIKDSDMESVIDAIFNHEFTGHKVFIIEEAQAMDDKRVQPKWLEPLMHIPENVTIIFCTTHYNQIIPQIRNRAQSFFFETPSTEECMDMIYNIADKMGFEAPSSDILEYFIKSNKNSPRGIIQTLESFVLSEIKNEEQAREFFRISDSGIFHRAMCNLIDNNVDLYKFVRFISEADVTPADLTYGLRDHVMSIILELSLGTPQGIHSNDRKEIQAILKDQGDKIFLRLMEDIGNVAEHSFNTQDDAMAKLITLKLRLLNMTSKDIVKENLGSASAARIESMNNTYEKGISVKKDTMSSDTGRTIGAGLVKDKSDLLKAMKHGFK